MKQPTDPPNVVAFLSPDALLPIQQKSKPIVSSRPVDSSTIKLVGTDSELSDPDSADPIDGLTPKVKAIPVNGGKEKKAASKQKPQAAEKKVPKSNKGKVTPKEERKEVTATGKGKGKAVEADETKKVRTKPVKKPEVIVEPPAFEKVDTRLGKNEAEQRMHVSLREASVIRVCQS